MIILQKSAGFLYLLKKKVRIINKIHKKYIQKYKRINANLIIFLKQ